MMDNPKNSMELVRNETLMFFFEKLMDNGTPQSMHSLISLFDSKGFTKEMRKVAGESHSDLKKFLSRHPSLFTLDGDLVSVSQNSFYDSDVWKGKMNNIKVITTTKECSNIVDGILARKSAISIDFEGLYIGKNGKLTLMQVANEDGSCFIFDLFVCPQLITSGLQCLLESEKIPKAAIAVVQLQKFGQPVYIANSLNLKDIYKIYGLPIDSFKNRLRTIIKKDPWYWILRPLSKDMLAYAASDVLTIMPKLYKMLSIQIYPPLTELLEELCEYQVYLYLSPENIQKHKDQLKIDNELQVFEEKMCTVDKKNIFLSNKELTLLRYLGAIVEEKEKLKESIKVPKKLEIMEGENKKYNGKDCDPYEFHSLDSNIIGKPTSTDNSSSERELQSIVSKQQLSLTECFQKLNDLSVQRTENFEYQESLLGKFMNAKVDNTDSLDTTPKSCNCTCCLFATETDDIFTQTEPL